MMRINIGQRLGLLLASFSLLAALLLGYMTYTAARDMLVERAQRTLLDTTHILSSHLQAGFAQLGRDATMLAMSAGGLPLPGGAVPTAAQAQSLDLLGCHRGSRRWANTRTIRTLGKTGSDGLNGAEQGTRYVTIGAPCDRHITDSPCHDMPEYFLVGGAATEARADTW